MKTAIAVTLLLCSAAPISGTQAAQMKTPTVTPHVTISQPKIGSATGVGGAGWRDGIYCPLVDAQ